MWKIDDFKDAKRVLPWLPKIALVIGFHVFLVCAAIHDFEKATELFILVALGYLTLFYYLWGEKWLEQFSESAIRPLVKTIAPIFSLKLGRLSVVKCIAVLLVYGGFIVWLVLDSGGNRIRLRSLLGLFLFYLLLFAVSKSPMEVNWRPVICGNLLQIALGFLILRWPPGYVGFNWLVEKIVIFLDFTFEGTNFVYGFLSKPPNICGIAPVFFFTHLQILVFFGSIVSVLHYYGVIQAVMGRMGKVMALTIGTGAVESLNAVACIFLGQTEAAILIGRSLPMLTKSEVHTVMTSGFAGIAGSLFSAYISFGACPVYLLSATIMSEAASLSVSKLVWPETEQAEVDKRGPLKFPEVEETSVLECISNGAVDSTKYVFSIAANLIVYTALLAFSNSLLIWLGSLKLLGYCFFPLAYMMGASDSPILSVEIEETMRVAELMGLKTVLNEFIAYEKLSHMIADKQLNGARARMIATYALCGFSNVSMIGGQIGVLNEMCPERKHDYSAVAIRSFIAGVFACFVTACLAGMLIDVAIPCNTSISSSNCFTLPVVNSTSIA